MVEQVGQRVGVHGDRADVAHVVVIHEAQDHGGVVLRGEGEHLVLVLPTGHVEDPGARREAGPYDGRLVGLHRDHGLGGQGLDHRDECGDLVGGVDALRAGGARLGADVHDLGALGYLDARLADSGLGGDRDALAVRRGAGEVDGAHHGGGVVADDQ